MSVIYCDYCIVSGASGAIKVIAERLPLLHQMLSDLLQASKGQESEHMTQVLLFVGGLLPTALQQGISQKALETLQDQNCQVEMPHALHVALFLDLVNALVAFFMAFCCLLPRQIVVVFNCMAIAAVPEYVLLLLCQC